MNTDSLLAIDGMLIIVAAWFAIGFVGIAALRNFRIVALGLFPLSALVSVVLAALALAALHGTAQVAVLAIGLPGLPFHLRLDALSAFFLVLLGAASAGISVFAGGYFRAGEGTAPGLICLQYHLFLVAMALVLLADDAYAFMLSWEMMALASFFLVTTNHRIVEISAPATSTCWWRTWARSRFCFASAFCRPVPAITPSPTCAPSTCRLFGPRALSCWHSSDSAPRPESCRCTSGFPRRTPQRLRPCRRS